jgi:small ligand-binding sensory domain FIST
MVEALARRAADGGFAAAHAAGEDWREVVEACLGALAPLPEGANLGWVYATDALEGDFERIVEALRAGTGLSQWIGTLGTGISACGVELHDRPALAVLVGALPEDSFRLFRPVSGDFGPFAARHGAWVEAQTPFFGIVHADPRIPNLADVVADLSARTSAFLVGGLTASRGEFPQVVEGPETSGGLVHGGVSGALFASGLEVVSGLTQGCSPIAPSRTVTEAEGNVIMAIDDRPAYEVFAEDIGELLARDLRRVAGYIFVAFPVAESDTGDYLVRNLTGVDMERGWLAVGHLVQPGQRVMFCRRDHAAAVEDMKRMLADVKRRSERPPRAGLYYSCVARGPSLFGTESDELKLVREELGEFPLVGFFANGEIAHDRLYGYTGVLALFL